MELKILDINNQTIAEVVSDKVVMKSTQDALDIMANASYQGAQNVMMTEAQFNPDFFDLRTRLAGDILQKYANYGIKLAIIGDFTQFESQSLKAFIVECNRGKAIFFVPDRETAINKLAQ